MKGHGAADWSKRPLPPEWLNYAALDVEVLIELRVGDRARCSRSRARPSGPPRNSSTCAPSSPHPTRRDRWRRTSGIHKVRDPRAMAAVRELWTDPRPHRPPPRHRAGPHPARRRDHQRRHRRPRHRREADRAADLRRIAAAPQRAGVAGRTGPGPRQRRPAAGDRTADRTAAGVAVGPAQTRGGRAAGGGPRRPGRAVPTGFGADGEPRHPRGGAAAVLGLATRRRTPRPRSTTSYAMRRSGPWQRELVVPVLAAALASTDGP